MKRWIKGVIQLFFIINTGSILGTAFFINVFSKQNTMEIEVVWQVGILSLVMALLKGIYDGKSEMSKKEFIIRMVFHYISINTVLFGAVYIFDWFNLDNITLILGFMGIIILIYVFVWFFSCYMDKKMVNELNKKLEEYKNK